MTPKQLFNLIKKTIQAWSEARAPMMAAALSYYTMFSIAPLLLIVVAVAGLVFGQEAAHGEIRAQIEGLVGPSGAKVIEDMMASAAKPASGTLATIIGVAALLFGATGTFAQMQEALNVIWRTKPPPRNGVLNLLRQRFLSFTMVLGIGFLLLVSLLLSAALSWVGTYVSQLLPAFETMLNLVNIGASFAVVTLLFAMIYKVLPDTDVAWKDVWLGAAVTSMLFSIGKFLIGLYLGRSTIASSYGAAGSLVIVLLWVNFSSLILFLGAQFTQVYANAHGSRLGKGTEAPPEPKRVDHGNPVTSLPPATWVPR